MLEWMMVLGYRQNCQNWIKTFISFFCSVCFVVYVYVINGVLCCVLITIIRNNNSSTQYKQLHTKFIHLLHKMGVGTTQNGTSISE